jgi:glycosyltransferase involved in cell wall biosynthesis
LPRLSVILPVRDGAPTLPAALESLLDQTFTDFEVLLFDDGSRDESGKVAERFASSDRRLRPLGGERVGLVRALERCATAASSPLLGRMDADDICHPQRLEEQVALLDSRPELDAVGCRVLCFPAAELRGGMRRYQRWLNELITPADHARDVFVESPLCHPSVLMRREAFDRAGGYRLGDWPEDYRLWLSMDALGAQLAKVPRVLFAWRDHPRRVTRTDPRCERGRIEELKLSFLLKGPFAGRAVAAVWGAGPTGRGWRRRLAGAGVEVAAFVDVDPRKLGRRLGGAPVLSPDDLRSGSMPWHLLVAVGSPSARKRIRRFCGELGWRERRDFTVVA